MLGRVLSELLLQLGMMLLALFPHALDVFRRRRFIFAAVVDVSNLEEEEAPMPFVPCADRDREWIDSPAIDGLHVSSSKVPGLIWHARWAAVVTILVPGCGVGDIFPRRAFQSDCVIVSTMVGRETEIYGRRRSAKPMICLRRIAQKRMPAMTMIAWMPYLFEAVVASKSDHNTANLAGERGISV